jgi:hypothetical protein
MTKTIENESGEVDEDFALQAIKVTSASVRNSRFKESPLRIAQNAKQTHTNRGNFICILSRGYTLNDGRQVIARDAPSFTVVVSEFGRQMVTSRAPALQPLFSSQSKIIYLVQIADGGGFCESGAVGLENVLDIERVDERLESEHFHLSARTVGL